MGLLVLCLMHLESYDVDQKSLTYFCYLVPKRQYENLTEAHKRFKLIGTVTDYYYNT